LPTPTTDGVLSRAREVRVAQLSPPGCLIQARTAVGSRADAPVNDHAGLAHARERVLLGATRPLPAPRLVSLPYGRTSTLTCSPLRAAVKARSTSSSGTTMVIMSAGSTAPAAIIDIATP
jgi:hypothetical protein